MHALAAAISIVTGAALGMVVGRSHAAPGCALSVTCALTRTSGDWGFEITTDAECDSVEAACRCVVITRIERTRVTGIIVKKLLERDVRPGLFMRRPGCRPQFVPLEE